jgi:hypothetical protein
LQCYERVIRDEKEWELIRRYIKANPENWEEDEENLVWILRKREQGDYIV